MKKWLWIIGFLSLASACLDEPDCLTIADSALVVTFKKLSTGKADTVILYNIQAESAGQLLDTVFYKQPGTDLRDTLKGKNAIVAVNPYESETLFTFNLQNNEQKFLHVGYTSSVHFISKDCGTEILQKDLKILKTDFDSVRVVSSILTRNRISNIEIFN